MARKEEIANSRNIRQAVQPCEELHRCFTLKIPKISAAFGGGEGATSVLKRYIVSTPIFGIIIQQEPLCRLPDYC